MFDKIIVRIYNLLMDIKIIRSNRKTIAIEVTRDGEVVVRAPWLVPKKRLEQFVIEKNGWIQKTLKRVSQKPRTDYDEQQLKALAEKIIPKRVEYFADIIGVDYKNITIRRQKTRWGSCSAKGNLNFNCMLVTLPPELLDYVVVHELCHRKQMNHSAAFWQEVSRVLPDYKQLRTQLKNSAGL